VGQVSVLACCNKTLNTTGVVLHEVLVGMYAYTGCDRVRVFRGKSKLNMP